MPHWPGPQELQGLEFRTLPSFLPFCHACPSPALFSFFLFSPQDAPFCPSDGHSCATSICWTTLWRNGVWQRQGGGKAMESWRGRWGWWNVPLPICLRSVGTSRVSHFQSTIKVNELFLCLLWCEFPCPEVLMSLLPIFISVYMPPPPPQKSNYHFSCQHIKLWNMF